MRKIFTFLIMIFIFYTVFQSNKKGILHNFSAVSELSNNKEAVSSSPSQKEERNDKVSAVEGKEEEAEQGEVQKAIEEKLQNPSGGFVERVVSNALTNVMKTERGKEFAEKLIQPIDADLKSSTVAISVSDFNPLKRRYNSKPIAEGQGEKAICGQKIKLHYIVVQEEGEGKKKPIDEGVKEYIIGEHETPEFNILPAGMKLGEISQYDFLSKKTSSNKKQNIIMRLVEIQTAKNFDVTKIKIFDDYISSSEPITCGNLVQFKIKTLNIEGKALDEAILKFKVSDPTYPLILNYILTNKPTLGTRTVIIPAKYLKDLAVKLPNTQKYKEEVVLVEINDALIYPKEYTE